MCQLFGLHRGSYYAGLMAPMSARAKDEARRVGLVKQEGNGSGSLRADLLVVNQTFTLILRSLPAHERVGAQRPVNGDSVV